MLISNSKKFIFIHIFKTAGTSVTRYLLPYSSLKYKLAYGNWFTRKLYGNLFKIMGDGGKLLLGHRKHAKANEVKLSMGFEYEQYFKFAFVRNPYDRALSAYYYYMQSPWLPLCKDAREKKFREFLVSYFETKPFRQVDYLCSNDGDIIVDYVGKYESLNDDLCFVLNELKIEKKGALERYNVSKKRKNDRKNVLDVYSKSLIEEYFSEDFECFGYE